MTGDLVAAIARRFDGYAAAWAGLTTPGIAAFWDADAFVFYKAEEVTRFFTRWDEVMAYWQANEGLHARVDLAFSDVQVLTPGPAPLVIARMDWTIAFRDDAVTPDGVPFRHRGKAMGGWNHVLTQWSGPADDLRLTGWSEVPDAPSIYLTELYYRAAG